MKKDLLSIKNLTVDTIKDIIKLSYKIKAKRYEWEFQPLAGKTIGMIFSKSSTRTRVSFEVGIAELGGRSLFLTQNDLQLGRGETIEDTARVMSRYIHGAVIRTYAHSDVENFAKYFDYPVINALTDEFHPCQILTDLFTIHEFSGKTEGISMAFIGDCASNMANSMILAAKMSGIKLTLSSPEAYKPSESLMKDAGSAVSWTENVQEAVKNANYIYTDVWVSMGCEDEKARRLKELQPYQVNNELLKYAPSDVKIMHCLPAHRGEEITSAVMDSPASIVFDQAENRLHVQKAILTMLTDEDWKRHIS